MAAVGSARRAASAAFFAQGLLFAVLLTHLPQFKDRYGIGDGVVTAVILVVSVIAGGGSVLAEKLARRYGSARTLQAGLAGIGATTLLIGLAPDLPAFLAGFAGYGIALGAVDAGSNMQAVAIQHRYGRSVLTSFHAAWSIGGIVGALYVAGSERIDLRLSASVAIAAGIVLVLSAFAGARLLRSGDPTAAEKARQEAVLAALPWRPVLLLGTAMACFYVVDSGTASWSSIYLHDVLHASDSTAALAYAAYQGAAVLSRLGGDQLVRRGGIASTVRLGVLVGLAGLLVAVAAPSPWLAIIGFGIVGIGLPVVAPLCFSSAGRLAPGATDAVVARVNIFNYAGSILGGVLIGAVGTVANLRVGFLLALLVAAGLLLLGGAFDPRPVRTVTP